MMKENSKKTLLALYPTDKKTKVVGKSSNLVAIMNETVPSGRRSMLAWWQKKGWIESFAMPGGRYVTLTNLGRLTLEQELTFFHFTQSWAGKWQLLLLRQAPDADQAFHALRDVLRRVGCLVVTRGVYAFPYPLPTALKQLISSKYGQSVVLLQIEAEAGKQLNDMAVKYFHLYDQMNIYSGISNELVRLLAKNKEEKGLINGRKAQLTSLYDRFFAVFCEDNGLMTQFLPAAPSPLQILAQLQNLLLK